MDADDETSGLDRAALTATCDGVQRAGTTRPASMSDLAVLLDRTGCTVTGRAADVAGHTTARALSPRVTLIDLRTSRATSTFTGAWKTIGQRHALQRTLTRTSAGGARVAVPFEGAQVAVVAKRGPSGGRLDVILDGKRVSTIDLYAPAGDDRRITYVASVPRGQHVLKLRTTGAADPKSTGTTVWLDAILVLDRRR